MDLKELKGQLETDLDKAVISSMTLLNGFILIDDKSRFTGAYYDPRYAPFYYHLGKKISPKSLLNIGFGLGIASGTFLMSCKTVENFLAVEDPGEVFYSPRLAIKNIKNRYKNHFNCYTGSVRSDGFSSILKQNEWDAVLVTETEPYDFQRYIFDILWENVSYGGIMVVDYTDEENKQSFEDFCKVINREPVMIKTRYGVGVVQK